MQTRLDIGSHVFIIEGNQIITEVVIAKQQGNFYAVRFLGGGTIQLRRNCLFTTKEDVEQALPKKSAHSCPSPYDYVYYPGGQSL